MNGWAFECFSREWPFFRLFSIFNTSFCVGLAGSAQQGADLGDSCCILAMPAAFGYGALGDLLRAWPLSFSSARDLKPSHVKLPFANLHWPQHVSRRTAHHFASFHWLKLWRSRSGSCAWSIEQPPRSLAEMSSEA